eukprot:m.55399 g.55399  ORF g.55399 m.55399 type:complete len:279 (-) comp12527_c1_seq4:82-918(-)
MRFKAKITSAASSGVLQRVVHTFSRLSRNKTCKLRLTPTKINFLLDEQPEQARVWADIDQAGLFASFRIESLHENNEIMLDVHLDNLDRALRSAADSNDVTWKLTKRDTNNFLTMSMRTLSATGAPRPVLQEVPVAVYPHAEIEASLPPPLPTPLASMYLPDVRLFKSVVDRMKALSQHITLRGTSSGDLTLLIETSMATVRTSFKGLEQPVLEGGTPEDNTVQCTVAAKSLAQFISTQVQAYTNLMLCLAKGTVLLFNTQDNVQVTFYVPVLNVDGD